MLFEKQRRGPLTTLPCSEDERKSALTKVLALLPASWRDVALRALWCSTFDAPPPVRRVLARDGDALAFIRSEQAWHVFTDSVEPESLLRFAMLAIVRQIAVPASFMDPIEAVMAIARRTGATLDADGIARRYSSMATPAMFAAVLLAQTLTESDYDPAHPLVHPAAEQLWPGSTDMLEAAERILTTRCEALLSGTEQSPTRDAGCDDDEYDDEEDEW